MLLSKPQKRILELVWEFGGLKTEMLFVLSGRPPNYESLIRQLKAVGKLFCSGEYLCDEEITPCTRETETALEVMLDIEADEIEHFQKGIAPFNLTFFKQRKEKLYRYDICIVPAGKEIVISAQLEGISNKYRIICLVLDRLSEREMLAVPCEHCFVVKEKGQYHYYK